MAKTLPSSRTLSCVQVLLLSTVSTNCTWPEALSSPDPLASCAPAVDGLEVCLGACPHCPQAPALVVAQPVAHFLQTSGMSTSHSATWQVPGEKTGFCLLLSWSGDRPSTLSSQEAERKRHWGAGHRPPSQSCSHRTWTEPTAHFVQGRLRLSRGRAQPVWRYLPSHRPCPR